MGCILGLLLGKSKAHKDASRSTRTGRKNKYHSVNPSYGCFSLKRHKALRLLSFKRLVHFFPSHLWPFSGHMVGPVALGLCFCLFSITCLFKGGSSVALRRPSQRLPPEIQTHRGSRQCCFLALTVSIYLCHRKVLTAYFPYCLHLPLP